MTEISYGVIPILKETNQILLVQSLEGNWGFPKGHPEPDDKTEIDTALRELQEETAVSLTSSDLNTNKFYFERYSFDRNGRELNKENKFFIGIVASKKVHPLEGEIKDAKWFDYESALKTISFPEAAEILRMAYSDYLECKSA